MKKTACLFVLLLTSSLSAQPEGFHLVAGDARLQPPDSHGNLSVQSGSSAIVQWDSFSIGGAEHFHFQQFDAASSILNRVVGKDKSSILGLLTSNGRVYLINPSGLFIGPGGRIETANFVASTFDVLDEDFLRGNPLFFSGDSQESIQNLGMISCDTGNIHLFAAHVVNEGTLKAPQGRVTLAAGGDLLLQKDGSSSIFIRPSLSQEPLEGAAIDHQGVIKALIAELKAGESPYVKAIHCSGKIEATAIQKIGGQIYLVAEKGITEVDGGTLAATNSGGIGGTIHVLGEKVGLQGEARIDASGATGGGTILIGGDLQGKNPEIPNAVYTYASQQSEIKADALENGDGGKVIVWSDEATFAYGPISVRGGEKSGDGGFVEVSGKYLDFQGFADRTAPQGSAGLLLLDPINVSIDTTADTNAVFGAGTYTYAACVVTHINTTTLVGHLNAGNVLINTTPAVACGNAGTITVANDIGVTTPWTMPFTLTLNADAGIAINAAIRNTAAGSFSAMNFTANSAGAGTGTFNGIAIGAAGTLTCTGGGNITLSGKAGQFGVASSIGVNVLAAVTSSTGTITFTDCMGGPSGNSNFGVSVAAPVSSPTGTIVFSNCQGGPSPGVTNLGIRISSTLDAQTITAVTGIQGGSGAGTNNDGIQVITGGVVGSAVNTNTVSITATGAGSSGDGIAVNGTGIIRVNDSMGATLSLVGIGSTTGTTGNVGIQVINTAVVSGGDKATLSLTGIGGGGGAGTTNHGILVLNSGSIVAGTGAGSTANITLTGTGGMGTGGANRGVNLSTGSVTLNGTGTLEFKDCLGGFGGAGRGVQVGVPISATNGNVVFTNCQGGADGNGNPGIRVAAGSIDAKTITAITNIQGGSGGGGSNNGIEVSMGGIVGSAVNTDTITMTATGTGSTGCGFFIDISGIIQVNNTGTLTLNGFGSTAAAAVSNCNGIQVITTTPVISGGNSAMLFLTGVGGGSAAGNSNFGVALTNGSIQTGALSAPIVITGTGGGGNSFAINIVSPGAPGPSVSTTGSGNITFNGLVGASTAIIGLGNTIISGGTGSIFFNGPVVLEASTPTITTGAPGAISFSSTIDGPFNLSVNAGGIVTFTDAIGSITPPVSLSLVGSSFSVGSNITLSGPALTFPSPVNLIGDSTMAVASGGTETFASTINGPQNFAVNSGAGGFVIFNGVIGGVMPLASINVTGTVNNFGIPLNATATGPIAFNQPILTTAAAGAAVTLLSSGGAISVNNIDTTGTAGVGGNISLQPGAGFSSDPTLGLVPAGTLTFTGTQVTSISVGMPLLNGTISLSATGRAMPMSIATMIGMQDLTIQGGNLTMGVNESMTVLGNLTIDPAVAILSDIVALDKISITAGTIILNGQPSASYLSFDGTFYTSPDAHILSRLPPFFSSPVLPPGSRTGTIPGISTRSFFQTLLMFGSTVLNYDFQTLSFSEASLIFQELVANSQLANLLPILPIVDITFFPVYAICTNKSEDPKNDEHCGAKDFRPFIFEDNILTEAGLEKIEVEKL